MTRTTLITKLSTQRRPLHELATEWELTTDETNLLKRLRAARSISSQQHAAWSKV